MLTFILCIAALVVGYIFYGKRVDKIFGSDDRETPAIALNDGVDFVPMKGWKIFLVQLLNIAGLGPIFGALNGALFGPVARPPVPGSPCAWFAYRVLSCD